MLSRRRVAVAIAFAVLACLVTPVAEAQYFGRNKVQYRDFDFKILKTDHFDVYYYDEEKTAAEDAARMAERWYARLSRVLGHEFVRRQPLILYASHPHFEQTTVLQGEIGESTGGVTEVFKRRVVMPFAGPLAETDHVLGHELVHAFQFDITGQGGPTSSSNVPNAVRMPLWFIEGMAEYLSVGPVDPHTAMWMRDSARRDKLPTLRQLNDPEYFPYRFGQALWSYIAGRWGDDAVARILRGARRGADPERIIEAVIGLSAKDLSEQWHEAIRASYAPLLEGKQPASRYGRALITEKNAGELNVAPSLSPDGRHLMFLSEKDLFSIDLFLADANSGKVRHKIVETAADPHFESLQFINSSGAFDRTGRRFAFGAIEAGAPVIAIIDVDSRRREREVRLPELGEIFDPTWAPDGNQIAFSAIVGGYTDLFVYDLQQSKLRRLTTDAFADLHPTWSPDGRSIAYVTDRYSTDLATLAAGNYRLALLDPSSGESRPLPSFEGVKSIDPNWSEDGASLFFISDRNGISNVYRLELASGQKTQITDLLTGVSGITALSPALSSARGRIVFSTYEEGQYRIYSVEDATVLAGRALDDAPERARASTLPPVQRAGEEVAVLKADTRFGLPPARGFETKPYESKLSLDYVGQPTLAVGADPLGTYVGGGVSFLFSDMLGHHTLGAVAQVNGDVKDFGGQVSYENRKHRWIWGGSLEQFPYRTGRFSSRLSNVQGEQVVVDEVEIFRQTSRSLSSFIAYPFSRATRFEVGAAYRDIGFSRELRTQVFSLRTNELLADDKQDLDAPEGLRFAETSAALVHDTSVFGATSPILGKRYRFEVSPTFGELRFTGVLADYRHYFMPVRPTTIAARVLHFGRYGGDSDDSRLQPLFIGYPTLVRGYDVNSFSASECVDPSGGCPVFDQLLGDKVAVANLELRIPPFGIFGARNLYGPVPIELFAFGDAGVAWTSADKASFLGGDRKHVTSVGVGARVNVFGYAVVEIDYVRPLDRPNKKGWAWVFNFSPGY